MWHLRETRRLPSQRTRDVALNGVVDDKTLFCELYEREGKAVLVFLARRTFDADIALELTAETFAIALESWTRLRPLSPDASHAWLLTVASRLYGRYLRRARIERRALQRLGIRVPTVHEEDLARIEDLAGLRQIRETLSDGSARLSDEQQEAVRLRVVEERSYGEIAETLGITQQTARARVSRGLRQLAAAVSPKLEQPETR